MMKGAARMLIAGTGSGCGKTTVVCAILQALKDRGLDVASFKCGPDYIDPMFHSEILGTPGNNVDLYFAGEELARGLFLKHAAKLNVIEGAMGYYDGLSMSSERASGLHVARVMNAPAVLVVNVRGMALSAAALVRGFQALRPDNHIAGVILNRVSPAAYSRLKETVEAECGLQVYGFLPSDEGYSLQSRHLGLVTAREVEDLRERMGRLARQAEKSLDLDGLAALMEAQPPLEAEIPIAEKRADVRIAIARDRAFCFYYRDNLDLLQEMGAQLIPFSPLEDTALPDCDGLYLGGGYPELYTRRLSENQGMLLAIREAVEGGLPTVAECGGFMLLADRVDGMGMAGVVPAECADAHRLVRFGYGEFRAPEDSLLFEAGDVIRGHEFHHWDATHSGEALEAKKPSGRSWKCAYATDTLYAGFPHLYFPSAPKAAARWIEKCRQRRNRG